MKHAYLTIDDAPSADFLAKVQLLGRRGIPALFFCIGERIEARFEEVVQAVRAGFVVGNHSYSHPHFSDLSEDEGYLEIERTDALVEEVYRAAGVPRPGKFFRFPYFDRGAHGSSREYEAHWSLPPAERTYPQADRRDALQRRLGDLGYTLPRFEGLNPKYSPHRALVEGLDLRCTFDQAEYHLGSANAPWGLGDEVAILARIDEDAPDQGRPLPRLDTADVVLVHDHEHTAPLFRRLIDRYAERGIVFRNMETI
jgi:peptidoglycan-N-acetylglucosamine deacetylase